MSNECNFVCGVKISVENNKQDNENEEEDPTYCEVCGRSDREDRLLLCDGCDLGLVQLSLNNDSVYKD